MLYSVLARQLQRQEPHDIGAPDAGVKQGKAWPTLADIDLSVLAEAIGGDGVRLREFAKRFVSSARQDMARVELALGKQDLQALRELGHHIKSPARMVGALPFAELCEALERNQQGLERAREIVAELGILLRRIEAQVASLD
jgi:HPt (histidine-containing phosphotransfer) domain-containing protein